MGAINQCICLAVLCVFVGCQPTYTKLEPHQVDGWAYVMAGATQLDGGSPDPAPSPTPGKCATCNGTGKVGDGRVFVECRDCGGDGIVGNEQASGTVSIKTTATGSTVVCGPNGCTIVGQGASYSAPTYYRRTGPLRRLLGR